MDIEDLLEESVGLGDLGILFSLFLALFSSAASRDYAFCRKQGLRNECLGYCLACSARNDICHPRPLIYQISSACACYCGAEFGSEILAQTMKEIQELRAKVEALEQRQEQLVISPAHDGATCSTLALTPLHSIRVHFRGPDDPAPRGFAHFDPYVSGVGGKYQSQSFEESHAALSFVAGSPVRDGTHQVFGAFVAVFKRASGKSSLTVFKWASGKSSFNTVSNNRLSVLMAGGSVCK